ncbi:MAG: AI-2E family transporter [Betaproteobacteria bacterium]|nr:AI-2E family transporter [Betaproteobacteria bacterium]MDH5577876.1 AI-2E family transporter [Betaproteobacteria bacterium]
MSPPLSANAHLWGWLAVAVATLGLLYLLSPILAPFLFAAILAYILDPLAERLSGKYVPRTLAVVLVMIGVLALLVALALVVLPLFAKELSLLAERLPAFITWLNQRLAPLSEEYLGVAFQLDVETVRGLAGDLVVENQQLLGRLLGSLKIGGLALVAFLVNLLLVPVVLFYLLRDWHTLRARIDRLVPRHVHAKVRAILREVDAVLAEFLRGQLTVILTMSVFYVLALWLAGLEFALPVGLITGLLVFVPYVGALVGFALGTVAALMQFDGLWGLAWVWLAFGIGQTLEGMVVTPLLVGERIGLHPVAVIFALLAFGQVFGFFGVLLALPASAALLVGLRHLRGAYLASSLYGGAK